jgi:hypothetical protein
MLPLGGETFGRFTCQDSTYQDLSLITWSADRREPIASRLLLGGGSRSFSMYAAASFLDLNFVQARRDSPRKSDRENLNLQTFRR